MKVQLIQQYNKQNQVLQQENENLTFKGVADTALRYLATNQGVGANLTDLGFMVIPRVGSDMQRGPAAAVETARREASGTANHSLIGVYGAAAGATAAYLMGLGSKYDVNANKIMAAPETLNILAENKARQIQNKTTQKDYLREIFSNVKAYNPTAKGADKDGYVKISDAVVEKIVNIYDEVLSKETRIEYDEWKKVGTNNSRDVLKNLIIADTGAESKYILESLEASKEGVKAVSETKLEALLNDTYRLSEAFNKDKVIDAFNEQIKNGKDISENTFIKSMKKFNKTKAAAGFAIATGIGMSIQPLNVYLTKLKTGSDGFVGVEGRTKDDSLGFKALKGVSAVAFGGMVLATMKCGIKNFMSQMAFKGFWPTIPQLKGIYGLTIISRLFAARDKDELRESLTKDTLGFLSWLVLGDIVNKLTATALDKKHHPKNTVLNSTDAEAKGFWENCKRTFHSTLKTRDEVLVEALSEKGINTVKTEGKKTIAKSFKEMLKDLDSIADKEFVTMTKKRLSTLNKAQLAGYLFSGLVLGLGIPNLNIYITNTLDKKRKEKAAQEALKNTQNVA